MKLSFIILKLNQLCDDVIVLYRDRLNRFDYGLKVSIV